MGGVSDERGTPVTFDSHGELLQFAVKIPAALPLIATIDRLRVSRSGEVTQGKRYRGVTYPESYNTKHTTYTKRIPVTLPLICTANSCSVTGRMKKRGALRPCRVHPPTVCSCYSAVVEIWSPPLLRRSLKLSLSASHICKTVSQDLCPTFGGSRYGTCLQDCIYVESLFRISFQKYSPVHAGDRLRVGWLNGGVPREQKIIKGHLPKVIYHQVY